MCLASIIGVLSVTLVWISKEVDAGMCCVLACSVFACGSCAILVRAFVPGFTSDRLCANR